MPPTCDSLSRSRRETAPAPELTAAGTSSTESRDHQQQPLSGELQTSTEADAGPFYGMLDRDEDEEDELLNQWAQLALNSPRRAVATSSSLPEASETFRCAMRQLDGAGEGSKAGQSCPHPSRTSAEAAACEEGRKLKGTAACEEGRRLKGAAAACEGKARRQGSSKVQKSASFSSRTSSRPAASLSASSSRHVSVEDGCAACLAEERRLSAPCAKHVQWADEAGVSDLVSVRLIKPRLAKAAADRDVSPIPAPVRSILYRLSGLR